MQCNFSQLEQDDLLSSAELYVSTFREPPWSENWRTEDAFNRLNEMLACPTAFGVKVKNGVKLLGFALGEIQQWNNGRSFYLKEMCIGNNFQRQGVGKRLMTELEMSLKRKNITKVYLITQRSSIPSLFYESLGFVGNPKFLIMGKSIS